MKKILSLAVACVLVFAQSSPIALAAGGKSQNTKNTNTISTSSQAVETDIIRMQKDFVGWTRSMLELVSKEGVKESGNLEFGLKTGSKDLSNEFHLKISDYISTTNFLKNTAEMSGKIEVTVSSSGSKYDYTKKIKKSGSGSNLEESYDDYLSATYEKVPVSLDAKVVLNVQVAVDKKFIYFTLSKPEVSVTGTDKEVKEVKDSITKLEDYTGKTFKVASDNSMDFSFVSAKEKMQSVLSILEKQALLEPKKKNADGSFNLDFKKSTLQSINVAMGRKKNADLGDMKSTGETITYKKEDGKTLIKIAPKSTQKAKNYILLENTGSEYVLSGKLYEKTNSKYNKRTSQTDFRFARNSATLTSSTKSQWSNTGVKLNWNGNDFSLKITESGDYTSKTTILVDGVANLDTRTLDLKIKNNNTEVATIQASPENTGFKYGATMDLDMLGEKINMFVKGYETYEYGNFEVTLPTNAELIDSDKLENLNF